MNFAIKGLFVANTPTASGNMYSGECVADILKQINSSVVKVTIQQMNSPERARNKIPAYEPIASQVMAKIVSAVVNDNSLDVVCEIKAGRNGKKLTGMLEGIGQDNLDFVPVGFGDVRKNGNISEVFNYQLKYVSVEPAT